MTSRIRLLAIFIAGYLIAALLWWAILLFQKNEQIHDLQLQLSHYDTTLDVKQIEQEYRSENRMIVQEGLFFGISLIIGIWFVYRMNRKQLAFEMQKNNFLLSVTHELKTPLASIRLTLDTLKNGIKNPKYLAIQNNAIEDTRRLESMINKLLSSARIENHQQLNLEKISAVNQIKAILTNYNSIKKSRNIVLDGNPNIDILVDREAFNMVISNLIENAIKFTSEDGNIRIEVQSTPSNTVMILVKDDGIGIAKSERKLVFDKFYRSESGELKKTIGSGLGLYIVNKIIERHEGSISISDNSPKGTIVSIELKRA